MSARRYARDDQRRRDEQRQTQRDDEIADLRQQLSDLRVIADADAKTVATLNRCLDQWQLRFCALSEAWDSGNNATVLDAVRLFVKAGDGDAAAAKAEELRALRDQLAAATAERDGLVSPSPLPRPIDFDLLLTMRRSPVREVWHPDYVESIWQRLDALRAENAQIREENLALASAPIVHDAEIERLIDSRDAEIERLREALAKVRFQATSPGGEPGDALATEEELARVDEEHVALGLIECGRIADAALADQAPGEPVIDWQPLCDAIALAASWEVRPLGSDRCRLGHCGIIESGAKEHKLSISEYIYRYEDRYP